MISSATQQRILITKKLLILHAFRLYAQADFLIERQKIMPERLRMSKISSTFAVAKVNEKMVQ